MAIRLNTAEIKAHLSELVNRVAFSRERLIVMRRGKPVAALISLEDFRRLERLDAADNQADENQHPVMQAFGGWAGWDNLDELVTEIYAERDSTAGREVQF